VTAQDSNPRASRALLGAVLDTIVPAEGSFPGAGAVALDYVWRVLQRGDETAALLAGMLEQIARLRQDVAGLPPAEREAELRRVEQEHPRAFAALVLHTYSGYYSDPAVVGLLGLPPEPPQPRGYTLESGDLAMLERVRRRGPLYRRT